jgi:precorrin-2 dehydrogenase / sirohydrochlorin ferrochelatase
VKDDGLMILLRLSGRSCLVVGTGEEAARRATRLREAGARVHVVTPAPDASLRALAASGAIHLVERAVVDADLEGCRLAVLTDPDEALAKRLDAACSARNVLFCAVDQPEHGDYWHVAVARRGLVSVGISTHGKVPALAARLREELARLLDDTRLDAFVRDLEARRAAMSPGSRGGALRRMAARLSLTGGIRIDDDVDKDGST